MLLTVLWYKALWLVNKAHHVTCNIQSLCFNLYSIGSCFSLQTYLLLLLNVRAVTVAQSVEQSTPTPEIRGSNPLYKKLLWKDVNKRKRDREWPTIKCPKIPKRSVRLFGPFLQRNLLPWAFGLTFSDK